MLWSQPYCIFAVCLSVFLSEFFFTVKLEHVLAAVEWRPQSKHNSIKLIVAFPIWRAKNVRIFGVKKGKLLSQKLE